MAPSTRSSWSRHCSAAAATDEGRGRLQVYNSYRYTFDRVYDPHSEQAEVYEHSARDAVHQALEVRPRGPRV